MKTQLIHLGIACLLLPAAFAQVPVPIAKVSRYAATFIERFDTNGDGILQREEWENLPGTPRAIDIDGDGQISRDELVRYFIDYGQTRTIHRTIVIDRTEPVRFDRDNLRFFRSVLPRAETPPVSRTETQEPQDEDNAIEEMMKTNGEPIDSDVYQRLLEERRIPVSRPYHVSPEQLRGVPRWFVILDKNGDGQVSRAEFAPTLAPASMNYFTRLDKNGDGLLEPGEVRSSATNSTSGGTD